MTCETVWGLTPQWGQCVGLSGWKRLYDPMNACPVISRTSVAEARREPPAAPSMTGGRVPVGGVGKRGVGIGGERRVVPSCLPGSDGRHIVAAWEPTFEQASALANRAANGVSLRYVGMHHAPHLRGMRASIIVRVVVMVRMCARHVLGRVAASDDGGENTSTYGKFILYPPFAF
jgi:hypothetical protein